MSLRIKESEALFAGEARDFIKKLLADHKPARTMSLGDNEQMALATKVISAIKVDFHNS